MNKPIHIKPSLYAFYYERLKEIALNYGYNLVLHGSMNRDLDLIAIPWSEKLGDVDFMIEEFAQVIGGYVMWQTEAQKKCFPHGRESRVINIRRSGYEPDKSIDAQYYLDISIIPAK